MTAAVSSTATTCSAKTYSGSMNSSIATSSVGDQSRSATRSGHCVLMTLMIISSATPIAASRPAHHWRWKTRSAGPDLVWVSMIANRIRMLIAPM